MVLMSIPSFPRKRESSEQRARAAGSLFSFALLAFLAPAGAVAQDDAFPEALLPAEAAPEADVATLEAETELLDAISQGVALSLAYCEVDEADACDPAVSRDELTQLVQTVEQRITALAERHGAGEEGLEDVLLAYADVRDDYAKYLEQIEEVAPTKAMEPAPVTAEDTFSEPAPAAPAEAAVPAEVFEIFEDADESLTEEPLPADDFDPAADPDQE